MVAGMSGVQIGPGATQFTRIPFFPSIWASPPVKFWMAAFVAAYGRRCGLGLSAWMDVVLMTDAPFARYGRASRHSQNMAYRFVFIVRSNSAVEIWSIDSRDIWKAALFTSTSILPNAFTARPTSALQWASSVMSPGTATHARPAAS